MKILPINSLIWNNLILNLRWLVLTLFSVNLILFQHLAFANPKIDDIDLSEILIKKNIATNTDFKFEPILPISGIGNISSNFGLRRDPFNGYLENHQGLDYSAKRGTPILATESGTIVQSGYGGKYGNTVKINHGKGYSSKYGHASQLLVTVGQQVQKGEVIALVGSTGYSTGPHLHFELALDEQVFSPLDFLNDKVPLFQINQENHLDGSLFKNTFNDKANIGIKNAKPYIASGEMFVAVRVRSGKTVKW
jgi:murein DD-endopeptidase MepM/ murein hydrolase activator NlpD